MSLQNKTIAFIGAGNMGEALIRGLLSANTVAPSRIIATDVRTERLHFLEKTFGVRAIENSAEAAAGSNVIVLAVKPQQMGEVLDGLKSQITTSKLLVSIAAGVPTSRIEGEFPGKQPVVRVMPNMPALVGEGASALCGGRWASEEHLAIAEDILKAVGFTIRIEERLMNAVTALSGSGPAYIFLVAEAMMRSGVAMGLSENVALKLTLHTIFGAGKLALESSDLPEELRRKVTSPGGTTEAALKVMSERKLLQIFDEAIRAAEKRSNELSAD